MSLLQRIGIGRGRRQEVQLERELSRMQMALASCREVATYWQRRGRGVMSAVAVTMLVLGYALGVYHEPIKQGIGSVIAPLGLTGSPVEAAYAAYDKGNYKSALRGLLPLAEQGDARAQSTLGLLYYRGSKDVPRNEAEAAKWFRLAAQHGDATAQFNLGVMYSEGQGVPQDHAKAVHFYRLAAEQGNPQAEYNLGLSYADGDDGGKRDLVAAHMWFNLAAARFPASDTRGRNLAISSREAVALQMTPSQIAEAQRLAREWKPQ
jgi:TPR repeat protein